ncbi:2Fe-2S iron-sulfur cluster-binding protein [Actinokineospora auranticolor]|uniref:Xanthine dehydrogenase YagT iron-sulfur-binding subunit n=1 Tax=Actinokineospora auranticolor TaxID=155976 RepID=A0A2S6GDQ3_9PSEU|nr:2Fe-2S iron-sulfur cluster-binding protein [Actinokineospora auranticolor]PPK63216.1 xanthine dehydrogenase YagT iron-sulfur-binding subunit [Actinokineospora auranticolor]
METDVTLRVDGAEHDLRIEPRTTLLDALRERVGNTSPKRGCDHGQCGSCTVLVGGRRVLSCLTLAVRCHLAEVTTARGLGQSGPHPVQQAFLDHDGFQCGFCTPGQICSAVGMLSEFSQGHPSHASADVAAEPDLTESEVAERMSGNLCRCGAYANIVPALLDVAGGS